MHVFLVGLNHRSAPLWLRERAAFAPDGGAARHVGERAALAETLVLSTCNRVEIYGAVDDRDLAAAAERVLAMLAERADVPAASLRAHAYVHLGEEAVRHLCRVAAGLDSMVLGETQIVGQLKRAVAEARRDAAIGRVLQRLACTAFAAGKRARPGIAAGPTSMSEAAVRALGGPAALDGAAITIVGAGETAADVLRCLRAARPRRVTLVNRTLARAQALADRHPGAVARPWSELAAAVAEADVIFGVTAAPEPVVVPAQLAGAEARPRDVVDLGVPRNVDPGVRGIAGVRLLDVDALRVWSAGRPAAPSPAAAAMSARPTPGRERAPERGPERVQDEGEIEFWVERFARWLAAQAVVPTITRLRDDAERIREAELERALARLGDLGPRAREVVAALSMRLVNKLLHHPLATLSAEPDAVALADSARRLFGLGPLDAAPEARLAPAALEAPETPPGGLDGTDDAPEALVACPVGGETLRWRGSAPVVLTRVT